jgi:hypothetical protein
VGTSTSVETGAEIGRNDTAACTSASTGASAGVSPPPAPIDRRPNPLLVDMLAKERIGVAPHQSVLGRQTTGALSEVEADTGAYADVDVGVGAGSVVAAP